MKWYARAAGLVSIARQGRYVFSIPGRDTIALDDVDTEAMSQLLTAVGEPIVRSALAELCNEETIDRLVELGVLASGTQEELAVRRPRVTAKRCKRLVVAMGGAIRAGTFLSNIVALADAFADEVDVVISAGASKFVRPELFGYYGMRVWTDPYEPAHGVAVPHKHLAGADLILVAPASATTIQRLASGACSDLASLVVAISTAPVVVAPSMNPNMWKHPPIARNVEQLREDGIWVLEPGVGRSAADRDEIGVGPSVADSEQLMRALDAVLTEHASRG